MFQDVRTRTSRCQDSKARPPPYLLHLQVDVPLELRADRMNHVPLKRVPIPNSHLTQQAAQAGLMGTLCEPPGAMPPPATGPHMGRNQHPSAHTSPRVRSRASSPTPSVLPLSALASSSLETDLTLPSEEPAGVRRSSGATTPVARVASHPPTSARVPQRISPSLDGGRGVHASSVASGDASVASPSPALLTERSASSKSSSSSDSSSGSLSTAGESADNDDDEMFSCQPVGLSYDYDERVSTFDAVHPDVDASATNQAARASLSQHSVMETASRPSVQYEGAVVAAGLAAPRVPAAEQETLRSQTSVFAEGNMPRKSFVKRAAAALHIPHPSGGRASRVSIRAASRTGTDPLPDSEPTSPAPVISSSPRTQSVVRKFRFWHKGATNGSDVSDEDESTHDSQDARTEQASRLAGQGSSPAKQSSFSLRRNSSSLRPGTSALSRTSNNASQRKLRKHKDDSNLDGARATSPSLLREQDSAEQTGSSGSAKKLQFKLAALDEHKSCIRIALSLSDIKMRSSAPVATDRGVASAATGRMIVVGVRRCKGIRARAGEDAVLHVRLQHGEQKFRTDEVKLSSAGVASFDSVFTVELGSGRAGKYLELEARQAGCAPRVSCLRMEAQFLQQLHSRCVSTGYAMFEASI